MGQSANPKRLKENEAKASAKYIRISPQKLNLVAQTIRGKSAAKALIDLEFSKKRVSESVRKLLQAAVANAVNNHNLDVDRLVVAEAHVGKSVIMKRFRARAKGRGTRILKPISNMTIILKEADEA
ncbi:MAG: 50S ribosomal protein L22 [Rhodospirillales bacterium]|nr:50S ribosomal protein L22 [Alphaproteobacteria bacterium]MCB1839443.1 50S ribosomal protein L22 [Alphaproteobacteria bacterium]MCB9977723.1 50S ribosomal protein L22 [Rhodospirillales bacterium]